MGNVGIGTTAPETRLEIQGAEATDAVLALDADDGDDTADTWFLKSLASGNSLSFFNDTTEVAAFTSAGALQIDSTLTANGNITVTKADPSLILNTTTATDTDF